MVDGNTEAAPLLGGGDNDDDHMKDWQGHAWHKRPSVFWLLPPFCLFAMAWGGVAVPRLNIILDLICHEYFSQLNGPQDVHFVIGGGDNEQCQIPEVHARTSMFVLVMGLVSGIISAFTAPRLASLSDRYGRRGLMAVSSFGLLAAEIMTVLAVNYSDYFGTSLLYVGAVIDGLCGSFMLGAALAYSYGADCTAPRHRVMAFGAFQGCLFLGIAAGPALGGLLIEATGNVLSIFYVAIVAHTVFIIYITCVLPESLSARRIHEARSKHASTVVAGKHWLHPQSILAPLAILFPTGPGTTPRLRLNMVLLAAIDCTLFGVGIGAMAVIIMYAERQFHWRNLESSIYLSIVNSTRVMMLFVVLPLLITFFRPRGNNRKQWGSDKLDIALIRFAVVVEAAGYMLYALAGSGTVFTLAGVATALGGLGSPTIQSSLTKHVPPEKTGEVLGAMALLHSLARVVSPTVFNLVYAKTVGSSPNTVFWCLAAAFAGALVGAGGLKTGQAWGAEEEEEEDSEVVVRWEEEALGALGT